MPIAITTIARVTDSTCSRTTNVPPDILRRALADNKTLGLGLDDDEICAMLIEAAESGASLKRYWKNFKSNLKSGSDEL